MPKIRIHIKDTYYTPGVGSEARLEIAKGLVVEAHGSEGSPDRWYVDAGSALEGYYFLKKDCDIVRKRIILVVRKDHDKN